MTTAIPTSVLEQAYSRDYYGGADSADHPDRKGYKDYLGTSTQRFGGFERRIRRIQRFFEKPGSLLDYGCAVGLFVKAAKESGWVAKGLERSEWAATYGRQILGLDIERGDGSVDVFDGDSFDVVTLWDVLEHLEHPRVVMERVSRWLRPGGLLFLNTVNSSSLGARFAGNQWRHFAPPHHLQYFTRKSLLVLLRQHGFSVTYLSGNGVILDSRAPSRALGKHLQPFESMMTHWRLRPIATSLNLLDELELAALKPAQGKGMDIASMRP